MPIETSVIDLAYTETKHVFKFISLVFLSGQHE